MKNKKKVIIGILITIVVIVLIIGYWWIVIRPVNQQRQEENVEEPPAIVPNEYLEQGEKFIQNEVTEKLKQSKKEDSYEFYSAKVTQGKEENRFIVEVKNISQDIISGKLIQFVLKDQDGNTVDELEVVIPNLQPEETLSLSLSSKKKLKDVEDYQVNIVQDNFDHNFEDDVSQDIDE